MTRYAHILITVFFLRPFFVTPSFAQYDDLEFEHITITDGLPDNNIRWIFQDHLGFLWFGTNNGLVKYDGYKMTVYKEDIDDTTIFLGGYVYRFCEEENNNFWVGHSKGLSLFDRTNEKFISYLYDSNSKEPYANVYAPLWIIRESFGCIPNIMEY